MTIAAGRVWVNATGRCELTATAPEASAYVLSLRSRDGGEISILRGSVDAIARDAPPIVSDLHTSATGSSDRADYSVTAGTP